MGATAGGDAHVHLCSDGTVRSAPARSWTGDLSQTLRRRLVAGYQSETVEALAERLTIGITRSTWFRQRANRSGPLAVARGTVARPGRSGYAGAHGRSRPQCLSRAPAPARLRRAQHGGRAADGRARHPGGRRDRAGGQGRRRLLQRPARASSPSRRSPSSPASSTPTASSSPTRTTRTASSCRSKKISKNMQNAQIAIEDARFYEHGGLDVRGFSRAMISNLQGGDVQGASTLTQQFVKITLQENALRRGDKEAAEAAVDKTYSRKLQELKYALNVEENFTKDQILEGYLNLVYYGDQAYGVEAAALNYFGVSAAKLTLGQAALLAGIVQQPTAYNPVHQPQGVPRPGATSSSTACRPSGMASAKDVTAAKKVAVKKMIKKKPAKGVCHRSLPALLLRVRHGVPAEVAADGGPRQDPGRPPQDDQPGRADHPHDAQAERCRSRRRRRSPGPSRSATSRTSGPRRRSSSRAPARSSRWPRPPTSSKSQTNLNVDQKYGGGAPRLPVRVDRQDVRASSTALEKGMPLNGIDQGAVRRPARRADRLHRQAAAHRQVRRQRALVGQERLPQRRQDR